MNLSLLDPFILAQDCPEAFIGGLSTFRRSFGTPDSKTHDSQEADTPLACDLIEEETTLALEG